MEPIRLRASEESKNQRLDAFLASSLDGLTRSQATRLIESGEVAVNGRAVSKSYKLAGGEDIAVTLPEPEPVEAVPQDIPLDVVYEDADVIVVNKPSGMVVHPAPGHPDGTLVNALLYHCAGTLSGIGGALLPGELFYDKLFLRAAALGNAPALAALAAREDEVTSRRRAEETKYVESVLAAAGIDPGSRHYRPGMSRDNMGRFGWLIGEGLSCDSIGRDLTVANGAQSLLAKPGVKSDSCSTTGTPLSFAP